jgi:hypothetical protein
LISILSCEHILTLIDWTANRLDQCDNALNKQNVRAGTSYQRQPTLLNLNVHWLDTNHTTCYITCTKIPSTVSIKVRAQPKFVSGWSLSRLSVNSSVNVDSLVDDLSVKWSEVKWSEVKWSEVKWSEVKWVNVDSLVDDLSVDYRVDYLSVDYQLTIEWSQ